MKKLQPLENQWGFPKFRKPLIVRYFFFDSDRFGETIDFAHNSTLHTYKAGLIDSATARIEITKLIQDEVQKLQDITIDDLRR